MSLPSVARLVALSCAIAAYAACSESPSTDPEPDATGTVVVRVLDNGSTAVPVPDVDVALAGTDFAGQTDDEGRVAFQVPAGDYVVDATVCCRGPGFIEHHESVRVQARASTEVVLEACLQCL